MYRDTCMLCQSSVLLSLCEREDHPLVIHTYVDCLHSEVYLSVLLSNM